MTTHVFHGIHTPTGDPTVERLLPFLSGDVRYPDYGYILGLQTKFANPIIVGVLSPYIQDGDILIGHSNGAALCYELARSTGKKVGLCLINAALNAYVPIPPNVVFMDTYFNPGDDITEVARIAAALAISPVDVLWGEMGHTGYEGKDSRGAALNCGAYPQMPIISGHSDIFTPDHISPWGPFIDARNYARLSTAAPSA